MHPMNGFDAWDRSGAETFQPMRCSRPVPRPDIRLARPVKRPSDRARVPCPVMWQPVSLEEFEALVDDAIDAIPPPFADRLHTVAIVVEDEPPPAAVPPGRALLGLYSGVPRTSWGVDNAPVPSKISIFRGPLTRFYPDRASLAAAVESTVFHEVAHHFGISDDRLRELQPSRARPSS